MRITGPATEDEMVLAFLQAEVNSQTRKQLCSDVLNRLGTTAKLVYDPDLKSARQNALRKDLLEDCGRGYKTKQYLFIGFSDDVQWQHAELNREDFGKLRYIAKEPTWEDLSDGTRSVIVGAQNISSGAKSNSAIKSVVSAVKAGKKYPPIIAVVKGDQLVLVEGHTRATAYVIAGREPVYAIVGSSPSMKSWYWY
jgi:hypothetical protein